MKPANSRALIAARKLLAQNKLYRADVGLRRIVAAGGADAPAADLLLVDTLYRLKLYAAALSHLRRVLAQPDPTPRRNVAIAWAVKLGRIVPEAHRLLPNKLNLNAPALRPVRDELLLVLARRALRAGRFASAVRYARRVSQTSPQHEPARLVHWEALWRTQKLVEAGKVLRSGFLKGSPFEARAHLELARMLWRQKDIARARRHFALAVAGAKRGSRVHAAAVFERSLMRLHQRGRLSQLANMRHIDVRRLVFATFCALGPGPDAFAPYRPGRPAAADARALLLALSDNIALFGAAKLGFARYRGAKVLAKPANSPAALLMQLSLRDEASHKAMAYVAELDAELARVAAAPKQWQASAAASEVLQELTLRSSLARNDAGRLIRQRILNTLGAAKTLRSAVGKRGVRISVSSRRGTGFRVPPTVCPKLPKLKNPPPAGGG